MSNILATIALLYLLLVAGMAVFQRRLMYHPVSAPVSPAAFGLTDFEDVELSGNDETVIQLWYKEPVADSPTIVYFHGNAGNLGDRAGILAALANKGLGVAAVSYRGYGKSQGRPSEKNIYADARNALRWVQSRGIAVSNIALYGESLGTGVAVKIASEYRVRALFLQAPYTSVVDRAAEIYWFLPVRLMLRDRFDSISIIKKVAAPLMIFHGKRDEVIPPHHANRLLAEANEPKQAIFFDEVGHTEFNSELIATHVANSLK